MIAYLGYLGSTYVYKRTGIIGNSETLKHLPILQTITKFATEPCILCSSGMLGSPFAAMGLAGLAAPQYAGIPGLGLPAVPGYPFPGHQVAKLV